MHFDWWTLALQTVNVIVLIWILARFLFRPIARIVAARQAEVDALTAQAAAEHQSAAATRAALDAERVKFASERDRLMAEAQQAAAREAAKQKARAEEDIAKRRSEAEKDSARARDAAQHAIVARAASLALDIAQRLLARTPGDIAFSAFLDGLAEKLHSMPQRVDEAGALQLVTATTLSPSQRDEARKTLSRALGAEAQLTFHTDPDLIAGAELHAPHAIIRNSWRADLEAIGEDLTHAGSNDAP